MQFFTLDELSSSNMSELWFARIIVYFETTLFIKLRTTIPTDTWGSLAVSEFLYFPTKKILIKYDYKKRYEPLQIFIKYFVSE